MATDFVVPAYFEVAATGDATAGVGAHAGFRVASCGDPGWTASYFGRNA